MYIALRFVNPSVLYKWVSVCLPSKDQDDDNDEGGHEQYTANRSANNRP